MRDRHGEIKLPVQIKKKNNQPCRASLYYIKVYPSR